MQRKTSFSFAFCSLIRNFSRCEKVLSLENARKNKFFLCILLAYSYLCSRNIYSIYKIYSIYSHYSIYSN